LSSRAELRAGIDAALSEHPLLLYLKGTPSAPACGSSAALVDLLAELGYGEEGYAHQDVTREPELRYVLAQRSGQAELPQLFAGGQLLGGVDACYALYAEGQLAARLSGAVKGGA